MTNSDCTQNNSGSINISASGGEIPYSYAWTGVNNFSANVANIKDLPSGKYSLTLSDNKGCTKVKNFDIKQPTTFSVSAIITDVKCRDGATGAIKLQINGGTPPINFIWENGMIADNITNLKSGDYKVTITDNSACATNSSFPIAQPDSLILNFTKVDSLCNGSKGEAEVKVKGGVFPYTYEWDSGENTAKQLQQRVKRRGKRTRISGAQHFQHHCASDRSVDRVCRCCRGRNRYWR